MTINVAVKCPQGIVLGADSLVSIVNAGAATAFASRYRKLFQLGDLPAGVLLNGDTIVRGQTIEDLLDEFGETLATPDGAAFDLREVCELLVQFIETKIGDSSRPVLQLIVGGYSRGKPDVRHGELYTLTWPDGSLVTNYGGDADFGAVFGGRPDPIYRFLYGFDRNAVRAMFSKWRTLYEQTRGYIFDSLAAAGHAVPEDLQDIPAPPLMDINP